MDNIKLRYYRVINSPQFKTIVKNPFSHITEQISRYRQWRAYNARQIAGPPFPFCFIIETTSICNMKCPMCPYNQMTREKNFMPMELFRSVIDEIVENVSNATVILQLYGEPLIDKKLSERIAYCKQRGIADVKMSTNCTYLTPERSRELIESGLDHLTLSLDGVTPEIYESVRLGGKFTQTMDNVQKFLAIKGTRRKPYVVAQFIEFSANASEKDAFREYWSNAPGVDEVLIKPLSAYPFTQIGSDPDDEEFLRGHKGADVRYPCRVLWEELTITWDGKVLLCCRDYDGTFVVGDVTKESLSTIWDSDLMRGVRTVHVEGREQEIPVCHDCIDWYGGPQVPLWRRAAQHLKSKLSSNMNP